MVSPFYFFVGSPQLACRVAAALSAARARAGAPARRAASCSRRTTSPTSTPGRSGMPLLAAPADALHGEVRALPPAARPDPRAGGAFQVRRGEGDDGGDARRRSSSRARARSSSCSRRGRAATKGLAQEAPRRGRTRAPRGSRSRPGSRSCRRRSPAPTGSAGSGRCGSPTASRSSSTTSETWTSQGGRARRPSG